MHMGGEPVVRIEQILLDARYFFNVFWTHIVTCLMFVYVSAVVLFFPALYFSCTVIGPREAA